MVYELPFMTKVTVVDGGGTVSSALKYEVDEVSANALESFLLALGCAGVDLNDPTIGEALEAAVEAIDNHA